MKPLVSVGVLGVMCALFIATPSATSAYTTSEVHHTFEFSQQQIKLTKFNGYDVIRMTDVDVYSDLGKPVLPAGHFVVALPPGMRAASIEVRPSDATEIPGTYHVIPGQLPRPLMRDNTPPMIEPDRSVYDADAVYPGVLVTLDRQANLAGQQIAMVTVYPVQYTPSMRKLVLHTRLELIVRCVPMTAADDAIVEQYNTFTQLQRNLYQNMLETMVINPEAVQINPGPAGPAPLVPPGQYDHVIVTTTTLKPYFQPIADWHMKKGIRDTIITTDWIYANYAGPDDTTKIRQFVIDANANWGTMYFLMGGENADVPYGERHYYGDYPDQIAPSGQFYSDYDDDWVHEVYVGRVSGDTESQIGIFVDKLMKYEKDPPLTDYTTEAFYTGFDLDNDTPAELLKDSIETFTPGYFTVHKVYDSHGGMHEDSVDHYLNMGCNLVNHMDHSGKTGMGTGYHHHGWILNSSEVDALTNNNELSVVTTGGCEPAAFDYNDCIGEHFVIYNDLQAAVAFIGNSRHGWYYGGDPYSLSSEIDLWFYYGLFTQGKDDLGEALIYAKHQFATPDDWDKACEWNVNLLGDPAMPIWTDTPASLIVEHDSTVPEGTSDFTVTVTEDDGTTPVENALVCCYIPDQTPPMHVTDYTDASGTAVLSISPSTPDDTMYVTASKHNYIPDEGHALVVSQSPDAPHIVMVEKSGSDARIVWNLVTTSESGDPLTMDHYIVYRSTAADFVPGGSDSIGVTVHPGTTYTDGGAVNGTASYYYLVKAVSAAVRKSAKSNMGYVFHKTVNENSAASDKNWTSLPWVTTYTTISDLTDDVSPAGDPLIKIANLRDDQNYESWLWDDLFMEWQGTNFNIESGRAYEMVTIQDTFIVFAGCNEPDGLVPLNENALAADKNWVSNPYNAVYTTVNDITDEYSPNGDPLIKLTNLRDDQHFESWIWDDLFLEWSGANFSIEAGRGYEFITIVDTTWDPTEFTNSGSKHGFFAARGSDLDIRNGTAISSDRRPVWQNAICQTQRTTLGVERRASGVEREAGVSHIVRMHLAAAGYDNIIFTAYRPDAPQDVLTEQMIGSCITTNGEYAVVTFDVGNFVQPWVHRERLVVLVEALKNDAGCIGIADILLDQSIDIQNAGEIVMAAIPQPQQHANTVAWEGIDSDCIVGYSIYHHDKRLNETIVTANDYAYSGYVNIRPVLVGGFETVYGSDGTHGDERSTAETAFVLSRNPSHSRVTVDYQISQAGHVCLKVFDISGRLVRTVLNSVHIPGYYSAVWDGTDVSGRAVPAGVYFVQFTSPDFARTQKSILLR